MKKEITKTEFERVFNKHMKNKIVLFVYKYFSSDTTRKNMKYSKFISLILMILFLSGLIASGVDAPNVVIMYITYTFAGLFLSLITLILTGVIIKNIKINKISKELKLSLYDYNKLAEKYN